MVSMVAKSSFCGYGDSKSFEIIEVFSAIFELKEHETDVSNEDVKICCSCLTICNQ